MTTATDPFGSATDFTPSTPDTGDSSLGLGSPDSTTQRNIFGDTTAPPSVITPSQNNYVAPSWLSETLMKEAVMGSVATAAMSRQSIPWKPWNAQSRADAAEIRNALHPNSIREGFKNDGLSGARSAISNNGISGIRPNQAGSEMASAYRNLMNPGQFNLANQAQSVLGAANYSTIADDVARSATSALDDTAAAVKNGLDPHVTALADSIIDGTPNTTAFDPFHPSAGGTNLVGDEAMKSAAHAQAAAIQQEATGSLVDNVAKHSASYAPDGYDPRHVASSMGDNLSDDALKHMGTGVGDDLSHKLTQELIGRGVVPQVAESAAKQVGSIVAQNAVPAVADLGEHAAAHAAVQRALTNITPESRLMAAANQDAAEKAVREGAEQAAKEGGEKAAQEGGERAARAGVTDAARSGVRHAVGSRLATASLGERRVGRAATWATNRIGSRMERQALERAEKAALRKALIHEAAKEGAKLGILNAARIGALSIPVAGWAVSAALTVLFWAFDPGERKLVKGPIEWAFSDSHTPAFDAGPEWGRTQYLPLTNDGNRDPIIVARDTPMVSLMQKTFGVSEDVDRAHELWNPTSPGNMGFGDLNAFLQNGEGLAQKISQLQQAFVTIQRKYEDEQIVQSAFNASLAASAKGLGQLSETVLPNLTNGMGSGSAAVQNVWARFVDENSKSRKAITESTGSLQWNPLKLFVNEVDEGSMGDMSRVLLDTDQKINDAKGAVAGATSGWLLNPKTSTTVGAPQANPTDTPSTTPTSPSSTIPGTTTIPDTTTTTTTPSPDTTTGSKNNDLSKTISDILGSQNPTSPTATDPTQQAAQMAAQQAAQMAAQQAAQLAQQGLSAAMQPINQLASQLRNPTMQQPYVQQQQPYRPTTPTAAVPTAQAPAAPSKNTMGQPVVAKKPDPAPAATDKGTPAATTPPKVTAPAAATPGRDDPKPDPKPDNNDGGNGSGSTGQNVVKVGDHDVRLPDEKHAAMLKALMSSDGAQHPSVREAATRAGFHLPPDNQDIGQRVSSPAKLQPGDLVIGDHQQGIYTGDGRVYTSDGSEIALNKISVNGPHQGLFHLTDGGSGGSGGSSGGANGGGGSGSNSGGGTATQTGSPSTPPPVSNSGSGSRSGGSSAPPPTGL